MNPIFNEYITFLRDVTGNKLEDLEEGYFWLDNQIIKGFDVNGKIHKFYKIKVDSTMKYFINSEIKGYDSISDVELMSWNDLISFRRHILCKLEFDSMNLIIKEMNKFKDYTPLIPVSMGKDSMLTCYLVRKLYPDTKAIFNNTSLDCADTYRMVKHFPNCEIMNPEKGFYQYVKSDNMIPTRFSRFCCRIFKVGVMVSKLDHKHPYLMYMGMRNEESNTRSGYEDEWTNTSEWGNTNWQGILPIRKWSELDVWLYTLWKGIEINPKYRKGYSRVGCSISCPFYTKYTWGLDKYWYRKMYDRWRNILRDDFIKQKKWIIMNCTLDEYITQAWNGGVFRDEPTQEVIDEFCKYNNLTKSVALQYFNKSCDNCKRRIKHKNVLSMNLKMHGRKINKFYCKKCLMKEFGWSQQQWDNQIESFRNQGCELF